MPTGNERNPDGSYVYGRRDSDREVIQLKRVVSEVVEHDLPDLQQDFQANQKWVKYLSWVVGIFIAGGAAALYQTRFVAVEEFKRLQVEARGWRDQAIADHALLEALRHDIDEDRKDAREKDARARSRR
jgi:ribosomal protein S17E